MAALWALSGQVGSAERVRNGVLGRVEVGSRRAAGKLWSLVFLQPQKSRALRSSGAAGRQKMQRPRRSDGRLLSLWAEVRTSSRTQVRQTRYVRSQLFLREQETRDVGNGMAQCVVDQQLWHGAYSKVIQAQLVGLGSSGEQRWCLRQQRSRRQPPGARYEWWNPSQAAEKAHGRMAQ